VLLLVDELVKVGGLAGEVNQTRITAVAHYIGGLLDDFAPDKFNAIVTTLNVRPVLKV
jgi:hypothetical protein